jgi:hypothetical protein
MAMAAGKRCELVKALYPESKKAEKFSNNLVNSKSNNDTKQITKLLTI